MLPDNHQAIIHFQTVMLVIIVVMFAGVVASMIFETIARRADRAALVGIIARHEKIIEQNSCALSECRNVATRYEDTALLVAGRLSEIDANMRHNDYCPLIRRRDLDRQSPVIDENGTPYKPRKAGTE